MRAEQAAREFGATAVDGYRSLVTRPDVDAVLMLCPQWYGPLPIIAARLVGAALLCALIGMEREAADRAAGLRTHMLVGMAAAAFALITLHLMEIHTDRPDVVRLDPIRLEIDLRLGVSNHTHGKRLDGNTLQDLS